MFEERPPKEKSGESILDSFEVDGHPIKLHKQEDANFPFSIILEDKPKETRGGTDKIIIKTKEEAIARQTFERIKAGVKVDEKSEDYSQVQLLNQIEQIVGEEKGEEE